MSDGYGRVFAYMPIDYAVTASEEATGYPDDNLYDYDNLDRPWRSDDISSEKTISLAPSGTDTCLVLGIHDCNFTSISVSGTDYTIGKDSLLTHRYGLNVVATIPSEPFNVTIPVQATTDGESYFRIGRIILMSAKIEFSLNEPSRSAKAPYPEPIVNTFDDGGREMVKTGGLKRFEKTFDFEKIPLAYLRDEHALLDAIDPTDYILYLDNEENTAMGWLCTKDWSLEITEDGNDNPNIFGVNSYHLIEVI